MQHCPLGKVSLQRIVNSLGSLPPRANGFLPLGGFASLFGKLLGEPLKLPGKTSRLRLHILWAVSMENILDMEFKTLISLTHIYMHNMYAYIH